jgi:hypothetical protein
VEKEPAGWLISRAGVNTGPFSIAQLKQFAKDGDLQPTDHLWQNGLHGWVQATEVEGLFPAPPVAPVTTQAPAGAAPARPVGKTAGSGQTPASASSPVGLAVAPARPEPAGAFKRCPFCAERIQADAQRCNHCGKMLSPLRRRPLSTGAIVAIVLGVVGGLVLLGVVLVGIWGYSSLPKLDKLKEDKAKAQAKVVALAVRAYWWNHDVYPNDVTVLAQPDPANNNKPYLSEDGCKDPWGNLYQIDVAGPRHQGTEPDVFTTSPSGKVIGNWK